MKLEVDAVICVTSSGGFIFDALRIDIICRYVIKMRWIAAEMLPRLPLARESADCTRRVTVYLYDGKYSGERTVEEVNVCVNVIVCMCMRVSERGELLTRPWPA